MYDSLRSRAARGGPMPPRICCVSVVGGNGGGCCTTTWPSSVAKLQSCEVGSCGWEKGTDSSPCSTARQKKWPSGVVGSDALNLPVRRANAADWLVPPSQGPELGRVALRCVAHKSDAGIAPSHSWHSDDTSAPCILWNFWDWKDSGWEDFLMLEY